MGPLSDIKVLELGQVVAAPFCGALLADFGADVVKVEPPTGDSLRYMGPDVDGRGLWYGVENRNKKSICIDLKSNAGKEILARLIREADVMTENFRPGVLAKLGFPWEKIHELNPRLILARMSGYGQTGPYADRAGYDRIGVGMGGLSFLTGDPKGPPTKPGVSSADYFVGYSTAFGIMVALHEREKSGMGQELDVALFEPVFRIMEFTALHYDLTGTIRQRVGNSFAGTIPSGHFQTKDGKWVSIAVGNDKLFKTLCERIGRLDWLERPEFKTNNLRNENRKELDDYTEKWINEHTFRECFDLLGKHVPFGPIYDIEGIFQDEHYAARNDIVEVSDDKWGKVHMQGVVPKLSRTPGEVRWIGPDLGKHTEEVLQSIGYSAEEVVKYCAEGSVISLKK